MRGRTTVMYMVRTSLCSVLVHYTMTALSAPDRLTRLDLVLRIAVWGAEAGFISAVEGLARKGYSPAHR